MESDRELLVLHLHWSLYLLHVGPIRLCGMLRGHGNRFDFGRGTVRAAATATRVRSICLWCGRAIEGRDLRRWCTAAPRTISKSHGAL